MKYIVSIVLSIVSMVVMSNPSDWYRPPVGWGGREIGSIDTGSSFIDVFIDRDGVISPTAESSSTYNDWYNNEPGAKAVIDAMEQALIAGDSVKYMAEQIENNVITDVRVKDGKLQYKKGVSSSSSVGGGWSDGGNVSKYNVAIPRGSVLSKRIFVDGDGNKVDDSAEWFSAEPDNLTVERAAGNAGYIKVKYNANEALGVTENGLGVSLIENGGIVYDNITGGGKGIAINLPEKTGSVCGALAMNDGSPALQLDSSSGLRITNNKLSVYISGEGGLYKLTDDTTGCPIGIHTDINESGLAQSHDDGLYVYLNPDGSALSTLGGLAVNIDNMTLGISEDNLLEMNVGAGLTYEEELGGVAVSCGYGLCFDIDDYLSVNEKSNGGIEVDEYGVGIKLDSHSALSMNANGIKVARGDGIEKDTDEISVMEAQNGGIEVTSSGVSVKIASNQSVQKDSSGVKLVLQNNSGLEQDGNGLHLPRVSNGVYGWNGGGWAKIAGDVAIDDASIATNSSNELEIKGWSGFGSNSGLLGRDENGNVTLYETKDSDCIEIGDDSGDMKWQVKGWATMGEKEKAVACDTDIARMLTQGIDYTDTANHEFVARYVEDGGVHYATIKGKVQDGQSIDINGQYKLELDNWSAASTSANAIPYKTINGLGWTPAPEGTQEQPKALVFNGSTFAWGNAGGGGGGSALRVYTDGQNGSTGDHTIGAPAATTNVVKLASQGDSRMKFTVNKVDGEIVISIGAYYK